MVFLGQVFGQVFLGQVFGQALGQARGVVLGRTLAGVTLGLASVVVRAMQAIDTPLEWKQVVVIGFAVVEARSGSSLEEWMERLPGVNAKTDQWMVNGAYPPAFGLRGWVASALPIQRNGQDEFRLQLRMTDSWKGPLCSTEKELEEERVEELENDVVGAIGWQR